MLIALSRGCFLFLLLFLFEFSFADDGAPNCPVADHFDAIARADSEGVEAAVKRFEHCFRRDLLTFHGRSAMHNVDGFGRHYALDGYGF